MRAKVLITGGSGLIGSRLTQLLLQKQYQVIQLGRTRRKASVPTFVWDVEAGTVDIEALQGVTHIIHLAGAGVADKRWTPARKKEILDSRVNATRVLYQTLHNTPHQVQAVLAASAIGYYGFTLSDTEFTEESAPGNDFLAQVVKVWEAETSRFADLQLRTVQVRIGIVLSTRGGALAEMMKPVRWGAGSLLGSGKQWLSWIHIDDLCNVFIHALEHEQLQGVVNAVAPHPVTNADFTTTLATAMKRPLWLPPVPAFVLKAMLGEMAAMVLEGNKVLPAKILKHRFQFTFPELTQALNHLLARGL
jgi:hypothetical protein